MNLSCIRLKNITKIFKQADQNLIVLDAITLRFKKGISYAITGSSGVGKSTLLHSAAGLDEPTQGEVYFDDSLVFQMSNKKKEYYTNHCLGFVFQQSYLINELSVLENVMLKGLIGGKSTKIALDEARSLLDRFGLYKKAQNNPCQLSGGQQQRVALARALVNRPDFLFADEPTGNLDDSTSQKIVDVLLEYQKIFSMGLIVSTHNKILAERLDHVWHISHGKIVEKPLHLNNAKKSNSANTFNNKDLTKHAY